MALKVGDPYRTWADPAVSNPIGLTWRPIRIDPAHPYRYAESYGVGVIKTYRIGYYDNPL